MSDEFLVPAWLLELFAAHSAELARLRSYEPCDPCKRDDHDNCTGDCPSMCCALAAYERADDPAVWDLNLINEGIAKGIRAAAGVVVNKVNDLTDETIADQVEGARVLNLVLDGQAIGTVILPVLQSQGALFQRTAPPPVTSAWDRLMAFAQAVEAGVLLEADPESGKWLLSVPNWNLRKVEVENGVQAVTCLQRKLEEWDAERVSSSAASKDRSDRIRKALGA